ncbi:GNAT family N-acetyltransferase [uncultured Clostridium sp.]|uniref:GNAT family N-acetyltransferase n=1 Tax=uncultured Clostridium sp. TaxID=59620 RepID=UPI003216E7EB
MNEIIYREIKKDDYETVKSIINESFGLYRYIDNEKVLKNLLKLYLQSCLAEKTFSCVAEKDGNIVGVILGKSKNDYKILTHLKNILGVVLYNSITTLKAIQYKSNISDYRNMHHIYHKLLVGREAEFDGVLTLFAVTEDCRGLGVGKKLLSNLCDYLRNHNTKHIYLYTDSTCNYGFYDSQGFERLAEKSFETTCESKLVTMNVFLYGYKVE